jgi:hypothetical protein
MRKSMAYWVDEGLLTQEVVDRTPASLGPRASGPDVFQMAQFVDSALPGNLFRVLSAGGRYVPALGRGAWSRCCATGSRRAMSRARVRLPISSARGPSAALTTWTVVEAGAGAGPEAATANAAESGVGTCASGLA